MSEDKIPLRTEQARIGLTNKYSGYLLPVILMVVDYCAVLCAEKLAFELRNFFIPDGGMLEISWLSFFVICPLTYIIFFHMGSLYTRRMQFWRIIARIFKINIYATVAIVVMMYAAHIAGTTSRLFTFLFWILVFFFVVLFRYVVKKILSAFNILSKPVLFMGAGKTATLILEHFQQDTGLDYEFIGYLEDHEPEPEIASKYHYLGKFADAEKVIQETGIQSVIITAPGLDNTAVQQLIYRCSLWSKKFLLSRTWVPCPWLLLMRKV
jgi:FlaA1/EpsC-like NDP-sugar epimerase